MSKVRVEFIDVVAVIRLDDPTTMNAVDVEMIDELSDAFSEAVLRARAIVLTATGKAFSSGGRMDASLLGAEDAPMPSFGEALERHVNPLMQQLSASPVPWLSAIRGAAAGVGCSIALAADIIVAAEDAFFLQAFAKVGLVPDGGAAWLLARAVGRPRAMEMMLLAERLPAANALDWGLINRVTSGENLEPVALSIARQLADGPTASLRLIRRLAWQAAESGWADSLQAEAVAQHAASGSEDFREGVAAFIGKRAPRFQGR